MSLTRRTILHYFVYDGHYMNRPGNIINMDMHENNSIIGNSPSNNSQFAGFILFPQTAQKLECKYTTLANCFFNSPLVLSCDLNMLTNVPLTCSFVKLSGV